MVDASTTAQFRRGVAGPCILALLASGPRYGLQLVKELNDVGQLLTSQGTLYPLLNRLYETGLVSSRWEMGESERPRRYYEITAAGLAELAAFREAWTQFTGAVNDLMSTVPRSTAKGALT